jgi:hypothetical protein
VPVGVEKRVPERIRSHDREWRSHTRPTHRRCSEVTLGLVGSLFDRSKIGQHPGVLVGLPGWWARSLLAPRPGVLHGQGRPGVVGCLDDGQHARVAVRAAMCMRSVSIHPAPLGVGWLCEPSPGHLVERAPTAPRARVPARRRWRTRNRARRGRRAPRRGVAAFRCRCGAGRSRSGR